MINLRQWTLAAAVLAAAATLALPSPAATAPIIVIPISAQRLKSAIAAQKGRVVVVNFWATWCGPCVQEFPGLVHLQQRYAHDGLVVFAVSADMRKDIPGKVMPFLRKEHAAFPQYLQESKDPEDFINAFDPSWYGDLPRTFIYDRSGHLAKVLAGEQTQKALVAAVTPLLRHEPPRPVSR